MAHKGVFLISLGLRYKGYSSNTGRTFIIDADKVRRDLSSRPECTDDSHRNKRTTTIFSLRFKQISSAG